MSGATFPPDTLSSSSNSSPLFPSSLPSQASQASSSRHTSNLPQPPPPDRVPPPRHRHSTSNKFKIGRNKGREKSHKRQGSIQAGEEVEDDWLIEGGSLPVRRGSEARMAQEELTPPLFDSQLTEVPRQEDKEKKKGGRGRGLAKKTSQLFSRSSRDKDSAGSGAVSPDIGTSLQLPSSSRQNSHSSSIASGDSSSSRPFSLGRPSSSSSRQKSPRSSHSRRMSQESSGSWQAPPPRTIRSGSSSTYDSPTEISHLPIPHRQASNLSASVPTLSRNALPQPSSVPDTSSAFPSRVSTWFSHLLPSSSTTSVSAAPLDPQNSSPQRKPASAAASFLNAARQRAVDGVRHLLDSEATPDKCPDTIWVMGSPHPGWRPSTPSESSTPLLAEGVEELEKVRQGSSSSGKPSPPSKGDQGSLRPPTWKRKDSQPTSPPAKGLGNLFSGSTLSLALPAAIASPTKEGEKAMITDSPGKGKKAKPDKEIVKWPDQFYDDFRSRVWCTYRSQYAPIVSLPNNLLIPSAEAYYSAFAPPTDVASNLPTPSSYNAPQSRMSTSPWGWSRAEGGLTSDAGWGCMLRTGQSMLANALIHLHLGRHWRLPPIKPTTTPTTPKQLAELEAYSTYVKIMSWFLDDPSPLCPFSVHRMALIGKELGKEVGEWFGPSTAAGALKTLGNSFPLCGLAVATAADSIIYKSDVITASQLSAEGWAEERPKSSSSRGGGSGSWGSKAVLVLIGMRLGLDGVNPIYYDSVKALFTFPQSVGIAGGRPSSSYYFVASQANSLFYLDPHFTRPAIPLKVPPAPPHKDEIVQSGAGKDDPVVVDRSAGLSYTLDVVDVDDVSDDSGSDTFSFEGRRKSAMKSSPQAKRLSAHAIDGSLRQPRAVAAPRPVPPPASASDPFVVTPDSATSEQPATQLPVDPRTMWYAKAYPEVALRTFHCEKVKKMPLSGLDPSMLLGFLITSQDDFDDFCDRVKALPQKIFTVQDEPPTWDDDDETGLESVSEPDMDELNDYMAETVIENGNESAATLRPVDIPRKQSEDRDEEWEEELKSTPSQGALGDWAGSHTRRPPPVPLAKEGSEVEGTETESWVRPRKEGEAPNGSSVL